MEACVDTFSKRLQQPWLTCAATQERLTRAFQQLTETLETLPPQMLLVIAADQPEITLAAVLAALATARAAVLGNPDWTRTEAEDARDTLGGTQLWLTGETDMDKAVTMLARSVPMEGGLFLRPVQASRPAQTSLPVQASHPVPPAQASLSAQASHPAPPPADQMRGYLLVPTGGTGGTLKLAYHNWQTLGAAIHGYARFWNTETLNAICTLPMCHIGGLMPALRTFVTGGRLCLLPWKTLQALAQETPGKATPAHTADNALPNLSASARNWQISFVPTQVQRLLEQPAAVQWLRSMQAVLIGGGASDATLLAAAAQAAIPLCPAYGMTETAATIALQRPEAFLLEHRKGDATQPLADTAHSGKMPLPPASPHLASTPSAPTALSAPAAPAGAILPHLKAEIDPQDGRIILSGESLFHGYFPDPPRQHAFYATGDYGQLQDTCPQYLKVLGRLDRIVISGGKKVDPALVEHCIRAQAQLLGISLRAVLVTSVTDTQWGQRLVAFIEQGGNSCSPVSETARPTTEELSPENTAYPSDANTAHAVPRALYEQVRKELAPHQFPKQWFSVEALPLNERGKPDRHAIEQLANAQSNTNGP